MLCSLPYLPNRNSTFRLPGHTNDARVFLCTVSIVTRATSFPHRVFVSCLLIMHSFLHVVHVITHEATAHVIILPQAKRV
jgi:hypothetical protein